MFSYSSQGKKLVNFLKNNPKENPREDYVVLPSTVIDIPLFYLTEIILPDLCCFVHLPGWVKQLKIYLLWVEDLNLSG